MFKSEKGSTLMLTITAFMTIFAFTTIFILVSNSSSRHAVKEEKKTKAYYVAKTGAESIIKHLQDKGNAGDMRSELEELITKTNNGQLGEGTYGEGKFEIEVKKETRNGKTVYVVKSKGDSGQKDYNATDYITAVLTPEYEVEKSWGNGTVDVSGEVYLASLQNLKGSGIMINTSKKKLKSEPSPIRIQKGLGGEEIQKLFDKEGDREKKINGYELANRVEDTNYVHSEKLINNNLLNFTPIELNYGVNRSNPNLIFPTGSSDTVKLKDVTINANGSGEGKLVNEKYEVIEFKKNGDVKSELKEKEALVIKSSVFEISGINTIQTSKDKDIVIVTDVLNIMGNSKINVKGPGMLYFYVTGQPNLYGKSELGVNIDDPTSVSANTNIHFYLKSNIQIKLEDNAQAKNVFVYGPEARIQLDGGAVYKGRMLTNEVSFNGECTIQSPVYGTPNEDTDPIIGFKAIEWER